MQISHLSSQFNAEPKHARGGETRETSKTLSAQTEHTSHWLIQPIYKGAIVSVRATDSKLPRPKHKSQPQVQSTKNDRGIGTCFSIARLRRLILLQRILKNNQTAKTDGNVYNFSFSLLKDAKRKAYGSSKKARSKTRITRLPA